MFERLDRQVEPGRRGDRAVVLVHLGQDAVVVAGVHHHGDVGVVLRRRPQHGRPPDVDVLYRGSQGAVGVGHGLFEGVEVHHDHVDRGDGMLVHDQVVDAAPPQDAAVDLRVKRFHPAVHHLRKAGVIRDLGDGYAVVGQQFRRSAGGEYLDPALGEGLGEGEQARFVGHADEGSGDG